MGRCPYCGRGADRECRSNCDGGYTGYPTISPEDVHPSHDVREEGYLITDPYCQKCRLGAVEDGELLREPCLPRNNPVET